MLSDALVILSFKGFIWDFKLSISASSLLNSLASLKSLFRLRFSCLLVRGASSNSGLSLSSIGSQVDICGSPEEAPLPGGDGGGLEGLGVSVILGPEVLEVHYPEEKLLIQLFSIESNLSIYALSRELLILALSCSPFYIIYNKMDNNYKDLRHIRHKEFNEFMKGKGFKGRNNYKLKDLKAMFGFKPMITGSPVTISAMRGPEAPFQ